MNMPNASSISNIEIIGGVSIVGVMLSLSLWLCM